MPTVYEAKLDGSDAVRYFHVPIANLYLNMAVESAEKAQKGEDQEESLKSSICAITFAAMTLEAFLNERAEDIIPSEEKAAFDRTQKPYRKPAGESSVTYKYRTLVYKKFEAAVSDEITAGIERLVSMRNMLIHYKLSDTAGKYILPPPAKTAGVKSTWVTFDFTLKPIRIEPPFIHKVSPSAAVEGYNAMLRALRHWLELSGDPKGLDKYPELTPPSQSPQETPGN